MRKSLLALSLILMFLFGCQPQPDESEVISNTPIPEPTSTPEEEPAISVEPQEVPFEITEDYMVLQAGNNSPAERIELKRSPDLPDNHIGGWVEDYGQYGDTEFYYENGFKRIRFGRLFGPDQEGWPISLDTLSEDVDAVITEYAENDIKLDLTTPTGSGVPFPPDFQEQDQVDAFLEYLTFVADHFKDRLEYIEILNEPLYMSVDEYVRMAELSVDVIRGIDPQAKIIIGAVCGDWLNDYPGYGEFQRSILNTDYLFDLAQTFDFHEVQVDGFSWHPLYDNLPEDPYYQHYPEVIRLFQTFAASRRFKGEYFADEILWAGRDEENWDNGPPTDPAIAAKYQTRAITEHRGMDVNVTINIFWQTPYIEPIRNLNNILAGAEPAEIPIFMETTEDFDHLRFYGFTLPDGDLLAALWINDTAVEHDPGVAFTLTIPDFSAESVTGIDVYYGFEQELDTDNSSGDLVIQNLLVKDYPTMIRFHSPTFEETEVNAYAQLPYGSAIFVENTSDSGPGSFRQALIDAQPGDLISFDPEVFNPESPATIAVTGTMPWIEQGYITIDASNAGVILDGSGIPGDRGSPCFNISSSWNSIRGLHIINFKGVGIILWENAAFNTIGGDPLQGTGPLGQGNLISGNISGIAMFGARYNLITGNQIGAEIGSIKGNKSFPGIYIEGGAVGNIIGPNNTIVNNSPGVQIGTAEPEYTTITRNFIYGNSSGILIVDGSSDTPEAPVFQSVNSDGSITGTACPACLVEIFSGGGTGAEVYEDSALADAEGNFVVTTETLVSGSVLTATATTPGGATSEFSLPAAVE
ncbi:MAG: right-handed parallel beta-helix repeat-containing protein [Anaerolineales bacterium]|nr:right-handed parallel beta-helix repeat-containing protein [Anaerolineales bacterium]